MEMPARRFFTILESGNMRKRRFVLPNIRSGYTSFCGLISVSILSFTGILSAESISLEQAGKAAQSWLDLNPMPLETEMSSCISSIETGCDWQNTNLYYVVHLLPQGFVLVAGDDRLEPIVGFAGQGHFTPTNDNPYAALVRDDLLRRLERIGTTIPPSDSDEDILPAKQESQPGWKWRILLHDSPPPPDSGEISDLRVPPLIQSRWGQTTAGGQACYNYYTPPNAPGSAQNYPTGCVATAMAQIMRYFRYPTGPMGTPEFSIYINDKSTKRTLCGGDGLGGPYNWDDMPYIPTGSTSDLQRRAIGAICHDAGVALGASYHSYGTSSWLEKVAGTLTGTFRFSSARDRGYPDPAKRSQLCSNLDAGIPLIFDQWMDPGMHALVLDGYGFQMSTLYYHFNYGWEGLSDGWYGYSPTTVVHNIFTSGTGEIISGRVIDFAGLPVEGATIRACRDEGGEYVTTTNSRGIFAFAPVPSMSQYSVTVTKDGLLFTSRRAVTDMSRPDSGKPSNCWGVDFVGYPDHVPCVLNVQATGAPVLTINGSPGGVTPYLRHVGYRSQVELLAPPNGGSLIFLRWRDGAGNTVSFSTKVRITPETDTTLVAEYGIETKDFFVNDDTPEAGFAAGDDLNSGVHPLAPVRHFKAIFDRYSDIGVGCTIHVSSGIYEDILSSRSDMCIEGVPGQTIIDGGRSRCCARIGASNVTVRGFIFRNGRSDAGAGLSLNGNSILIENCVFEDNVAVWQGGGLSAYNSSGTIRGCKFFRNIASGGKTASGGAIYASLCGNIIISDCIILDNSAEFTGGAVDVGSSPVAFRNCLFSGNTTGRYEGGALSLSRCESSLISHCTFTANRASNVGGACSIRDSRLTIRDSIIWNNASVDGSQLAIFQQLGYLSEVTIEYCNIQNGVEGIPVSGGPILTCGSGNLMGNPLFIQGYEGMYYLSDKSCGQAENSPCIDAGSNTVENLSLQNLTTRTDNRGDQGVVDLGFHFTPKPHIPADLNQDYRVDLLDFYILAQNWLMHYERVCPGLVAHWNFAEASGTLLYDIVGGLNGTIYGGASLNGAGVLSFDGSNDYVFLPIGPLLKTLTCSSFAVWVNFTNVGGVSQRIFDFGSGTRVKFYLTPRMDTDGPIRCAITSNYSDGEQRVTAPSMLSDGWHHVVVTIDARMNTMTLYLDGTAVGVNEGTYLTPSSMGDCYNNWFGRSEMGNAFFSGSISDFEIYNYALSADEVWNLSNHISIGTPWNMDLDRNGVIDLGDLVIWIRDWMNNTSL